MIYIKVRSGLLLTRCAGWRNLIFVNSEKHQTGTDLLNLKGQIYLKIKKIRPFSLQFAVCSLQFAVCGLQFVVCGL